TKLTAPRRRRPVKDWRVEENSAGWITYRRGCSLKNNQHPLSYHADWAGPVKLVESPHGGDLKLRYDFYLDQALGHEGDPTIDADLAEENETLQNAFAEQAEAFAEQPRIEGWTPPPAQAFAGWLRQSGYEPTEDEDHNLRLSIRRRGATGQVKLVREEGRLRLAMPLGRWGDLPGENRHAMQKLASLANARCRLARITWEHEEKIDACEARVDLSGLPYTPEQSRRMESFWRETTRLAMTALDLAVSQLAQELGVLAEDKEQELVKLMPAR
ncbi:MAG: hypothetical protein KY475_12595, partial [Planctomycetes bacterium]|nr:hypothetical protein [Planctomycetota bacterium]